MRTWFVITLTVAACGSAPKTDVTGPARPSRPGCPDPVDVRVATVMVIGEEPVWLLHEELLADAKDDLFTADSADAAGELDLSPDEARAHGATSTDTPIWLFTDDDKPPCRAIPRRFLALREGEGMRYTRIVRVLEGCDPRTSSPAEAWALQADDVGECRFREPRLLSERQGGSGAVTLPLEIEGLVPKEPCEAPGCLVSWVVRVNDFRGGTNFFEALVSWVYPTASENECDWQVEDFFGHFVQLETNAPVESFDAEGKFAGAFYDTGGVRALVMRELGVYWVYAPTDPRPTLVEHVDWWIPHDEDRPRHSLGPYCGP